MTGQELEKQWRSFISFEKLAFNPREQTFQEFSHLWKSRREEVLSAGLGYSKTHLALKLVLQSKMAEESGLQLIQNLENLELLQTKDLVTEAMSLISQHFETKNTSCPSHLDKVDEGENQSSSSSSSSSHPRGSHTISGGGDGDHVGGNNSQKPQHQLHQQQHQQQNDANSSHNNQFTVYPQTIEITRPSTELDTSITSVVEPSFNPKTIDSMVTSEPAQDIDDLGQVYVLDTVKEEASAFQCDVCELCYEDFYSLETHRRTQHPKFNCRRCKDGFKDYPEFLSHLETHVYYTCDQCGQKFPSPSLLTKHQTTGSHGALKQFQCDLCSKGFYTKSNMKKHKFEVHSVESAEGMPCNLCNRRFFRNEHLQRHIKSHAYKDSKRRDNVLTPGGSSGQSRDIEDYYDQSEAESKLELNYDQLEDCVDSQIEIDYDYEPGEADIGSSLQIELVEYKEVDLASKPKVEILETVSKSEVTPSSSIEPKPKSGIWIKPAAELVYNTDTCIGAKSEAETTVVNEYNDAIAASKPEVETQIKMEESDIVMTNEDFYPYDDDDSKLMLYDDSELYSEEKPFKCKRCNLAFKKKGALQVHFTTNKHRRGGSKWSVDVDLGGEYGSPSLRPNYNKKNRDFNCDLCDKKFNRKEHLQRHMRSKFHIDSKPYDCPLCEKKFQHLHTLDNHMKSCHETSL